MIETHLRMLVILLSSPIVILIVHITLSRLFRHGDSPQVVTVKALLTSYIPMALLIGRFVTGRAGLIENPYLVWIYCFIVYTSIAYTYFHFFNMSETARRVRILYEINRAGSLNYKDIRELYSTPDIVGVRIQRLLQTKQLKEETDGRYSLDGRLLYYAARFVAAWRGLIGFGKEGFEK